MSGFIIRIAIAAKKTEAVLAALKARWLVSRVEQNAEQSLIIYENSATGPYPLDLSFEVMDLIRSNRADFELLSAEVESGGALVELSDEVSDAVGEACADFRLSRDDFALLAALRFDLKFETIMKDRQTSGNAGLTDVAQ